LVSASLRFNEQPGTTSSQQPLTTDQQPGAIRLHHTARFVAGAAEPRRFPELPYPEIAFAGRSNVGKSSLLNRLVGQHKLARVSKTPGRTQQINFFVIDDRLTFVDLPGYGFARVPLHVKEQWKTLVETYLTHRANLNAVVVIVDLRRGVAQDDAQLIDVLSAHHIRAIVAATKADKLAYGERMRRGRDLAEQLVLHRVPVVVCSSASDDGVDRLWTEIERCAHRDRRGA
jgi:GTP-binding protein